MTVRHEIKSQLAKLLATEDLIVENKKVETAQFNVHTRVLTLPMWDKASSVVYDMLVGHEVGHALYTPDIDWYKEHKIPPQFVNIVEDVRIEKLIKRRYAGLAKTFYAAYQELEDEDFFGINEEDISKLNLADRANLYFKIGNYVDIPISSGEESDIIDMISNTETFDQVLEVSKVLYNYCKEQQEQEQNQKAPEEMSAQHETSQSGDNSIKNTDTEEDQQQEQPGESESCGETLKNDIEEINSKTGGEKNEDLQIKTVDRLEDALKNLVDRQSDENVYLELPNLKLDKIIVPNSEIQQCCNEQWENSDPSMFYQADCAFVGFKQSAQKEVNYLVKEFERRKSADAYARTSTARTGVLDTSSLHTYRYNEDLFKKVSVIPDGKNHGLIFVLDWSGSMSRVMMDTLKQLYNLIWFCKKTNIPFEVYAFTSDYPLVKYDEDGRAELRLKSYIPKDGIVEVGERFSMMNLFTSKVNYKTLDQQMKNIFRIAYSFDHFSEIQVPIGLSLSGTPLNEALISLHQILPQFKTDNNLQKVQCVVLTDGEACMLKYHREVQRGWEDTPFLGTRYIGSNAFIRDRKTGHTYSCNSEYDDFTNILLRNLRNNFKDINFIGIRVLESRDAGAFIRRYCGHYGKNLDKTMSSWKKEKAFSIKNSGYTTYFGISSTALSQDAEFDVAEYASKAQIKSAFAKSLRSKKMNKKVLGEFVELIV